MSTTKTKIIGLIFINLFVLQIYSQGLLFNNNDGVIDLIMSKSVVSMVPTDNQDGLKLILKDGNEKLYSFYSLGNLETFNFQDNITALYISNGTVSDVTSTSATIKGVSVNFTYNLNSNFRLYVLYGTTSNLSPEYGITAYATTTNRSCDISLSGLSPATHYFYQTLIKINGKYYLGEMKSFSTEALPVTITVTTKDATNVQESSATLNGSLSVTNATKNYTVGFFVNNSGTPSSTNYKKNIESGTNKTGNYSSSVNGLSANTTYRVRAYALYDGTYYYGETKSFSTSSSYGDITCPDNNHPHMIDLGLPSGTKWACCNVGASTPEDYGNYYAWGETQPKSVYTWDNYQYSGGSSILSNVVNIGSDIAGTQYDAATANWGTPWRMPSETQIRELRDNCISTWTTQNGVNGRKFTGPNGGTIFLPAAGYPRSDGLRDLGSWGYYWSSTVSVHSGDAYHLYINSGNVDTFDCRRSNGNSVRPVR